MAIYLEALFRYCYSTQKLLIYALNVNVLSESYVYTLMCAWGPQRLDKGFGSPGNGVADSCKLPRGWWELNQDPLQEQMCLTI